MPLARSPGAGDLKQPCSMNPVSRICGAGGEKRFDLSQRVLNVFD